MLITCPRCGHRFDAESVVVRRGYFPVRCSKCRERFEVNFRTGQVRGASPVEGDGGVTATLVHPEHPPEGDSPVPSAGAGQTASAPESAPPVGAPEASEPAAPPRAKELESFIAGIRAQYDELLAQDPFELLGVEVESSNQEVMQAYFEAAERYRATKFEAELTTDERSMLWELTVRVDAAFNELGDLERRRRAHRMRSQAAQRMDAQTVEIKGGAEAEYVKGYQALQLEQWAVARDHFARCVELDPNRASYHFRVGQAILKLAATEPDVDWEMAKSSFERSLEIDPDNLEYLLSLGQLWKARGNASLAMPYFKRVRDLDPGHIEANREISAYLQSKRESPETRSTTARLMRLLKRK